MEAVRGKVIVATVFLALVVHPSKAVNVLILDDGAAFPIVGLEESKTVWLLERSGGDYAVAVYRIELIPPLAMVLAYFPIPVCHQCVYVPVPVKALLIYCHWPYS